MNALALVIVALLPPFDAPRHALAKAQKGAPAPAVHQPDVDFRVRATPYAGPGRETVSDPMVDEILIGYHGPADPEHPRWGDAWLAAWLAIEEANQAGGYQGKPFRLVHAWSDNPWGTGIARLAQLAYRERVWAILGGLDGTSAHLAEQVAAKARLPLLCTLSSDRTANAANVPWIYSMMPGDHLQAPLLVRELASRIGDSRFTLISADDHDSRAFATECERALKRAQLHPVSTLVVSSASVPDEGLIAQLLRDHPQALLIGADGPTTALLVRLLRGAGYDGMLLARASTTGPACPDVLTPVVLPASLPPEFIAAFEARAGHPPSAAAAYTYDGANLLVTAIRRAGLNRARIGDALRDLAPWQGVTGLFSWDSLGSNVRPPRLVALSPASVDLPGGSPVPSLTTSPERP